MSSQAANSNWLEIDCQALLSNARRLRDIAGTRLMAVVKANGYGHGLLEVARLMQEAGVDYLGVARLGEALELRQAGIATPILVLGHTPSEGFAQAIAAGVTLTIFQADQIEALAQAAASRGRRAKVHLKVDTGMSRLGAPPSQALELLRRLASHPQLEVEGIFTHYARADEPAVSTTEQQERLFLDLLAEAQTTGLRPPLAHAANSAATLTRPRSRLDMVRCGIALYGMNPSPQVPLPDGFHPALNWKSHLSAVYELPAGRGVSYGHAYVTQRPETIGVVPVGYGDGYRRTDRNQVLIHGQLAPVIGRVCMDQMMVLLSHIPQARVGDEVVLIGRQGEQGLSADDLAQIWGTINYEVVCGLSARVPRLYR